jgi:hypothetical protein
MHGAHWSACSFRLLASSVQDAHPTPILAASHQGAFRPSGCGVTPHKKEAGMPKIVVTAAVKDVEAWLKFKPQLIAQMSAVASDGTSYVAMDGSNRVASTWDVPDLEAFLAAQSAPSSPEMAAAMERYGMIPPATIYIEK